MGGSGTSGAGDEHEESRAQGTFNELDGEAEQVVQARDIYATNVVVSGGSAQVDDSPSPRLLPAGPSRFTDRDDLLARLSDVAERERQPGRPGVVLLSGWNGVGKSATSRHWAYSVRHRFPDGQLYADLGGLDQRNQVASNDILGRFLRVLGVPSRELPAHVEDRQALYRSLTADRRLLMLLDNARLTNAVAPLLPASQGSVVIVTSHRELTSLGGLHGAELERLEPLTVEAGMELLGKFAGQQRVAGERDDAAALVRLCGGLPVAVCIVGGRLQARKHWKLARVVAELSDERHRPQWFMTEEGELPVRAACDVGYNDLPPAAKRLYRLLSLHPDPDAVAAGAASGGPGGDFGVGAAAALARIPEAETASLLEDELRDRHLVEEVGDGRYAFHGLVRKHARGRAEWEEDEAGRAEAVRRAGEWYLREAVTADYTVNPFRPTSGPLYDELRSQNFRPDPSDPHVVAAALDWLETERRNLGAVAHTAADHGWDALAWQVCEALWSLYLTRKHYGEWIATHRVGVDAARRLGDPRAEARMCLQLGRALFETGEFTEAHTVLNDALRAARTCGERYGEASACEFLGRARIDAEAYEEAIPYLTAARTIFEEAGRTRGIALQSHHLGRAYLGLGEHDTAIEHLTTAYELIKKVAKDRYNRGRILVSLGQAYGRAGRPADAYQPLSEALEIMSGEGRLFQEALVLETLGSVAGGDGDIVAAREYLDRAAAGYAKVGSPHATKLRERLARLGGDVHGSGSPDRTAGSD